MSKGNKTSVAELRKFLKENKANAIMIAHDDEFQSENLSPDKERLAFVTGFTGSAGLAVVTPKKAVLFVDGRYVTQAKQQTDFEVLQVPKQTTVGEWLSLFLKENHVVLYDPWVHTIAQIQRWTEIFEKRGALLAPCVRNPVDDFWEDRPLPREVSSYDYPISYAGKTTSQKISPVVKSFKLLGVDAFVVSNPDTVSWILNKRSNADKYTPVYRERLIIMASGEVRSFPLPKEEMEERLLGKVIGLDAYETPVKIKQMITDAGASVRTMENPFKTAQVIKNKVELYGMEEAALTDSIAVCKTLAWMKNNALHADELTIPAQLIHFRKSHPLYKGESFPAISAVGKNAAVVHYIPTKKTCKDLKGQSIYLLDTGAQYMNGTTDMTRTVALSEKVPEQARQRYTEVLKGHIALARAVFPVGTIGAFLDGIARQFLNLSEVDYDHGTGHGIGCYSNVHETPPSISPHSRTEIKEGMVLSNEPGFYLPGRFGIRIENMMQVKKENTGKKKLLRFEMMTFVPFCYELIDKDLLTYDEKKWISNYYMEIAKKVYPHLNKQDKVWLKGELSKWTDQV